MSYNGSGTFLINTAGQPVVSGTVISSTAFNALTADLATGLSTAITKDGQTTVTANIPMSTYKFTGLGAGSAATDSANLSQVQSTVTKLLNSVSGADTITATASPTLAAYAAGQMFYFVAAGDNTTSVTLNIDGLGAKAVTRDGSTALISGDIKSGEVVVVVYDGTRFQVVSQVNSAGDATFANVSITSALNVGGVSTFTGLITANGGLNGAHNGTVGATTPNTGSFTTLTTSSTVTLSGGTANGVLYLNGSKVATSGSGLYTDGSRLGIGTVSFPAGQRLRVAGGDVGFEGQYFYLLNADANIQMGAAQNAQIINSDTGNLLTFSRTGASSAMAFSTAGSEAMRITNAQNVGIGTASPGAKLQVIGTTSDQIRVGTAATEHYRIGRNASDGLLDFYGSQTGFQGYRFGGIDGTWAVINSSGNLGIGVTPSAWFSGYTALQIPAGSFSGFQTATLIIQQNSFFSAATSDNRYVNNGFAGQYTMVSGQHRWLTAPSGTAGNAISFTQAMTLDASGNLGIGTASPGGRLHITTASGNTEFVHNVTGSGTAARTSYQRGGVVQFLAGLGAWSGTDTYQIASSTGPLTTLDSSGNLGIGTTSPSVKLEVNGQIRTAAPTGGTAANWRLGTVHTVSPTSPNRTIEVDIGGTIYYLHAKTTNN